MSRRVLISASQFRFAKPGIDAANPGTNGLIFDGFAGVPYNGVYLLGFLPSLTQLSSTSYQGVVNLGKTFSAPPKAIVRLNDPNLSNSKTANYFAASGTASLNVQYSYSVSQTQLVVSVYGGGTYPLNVGFYYLIMQV